MELFLIFGFYIVMTIVTAIAIQYADYLRIGKKASEDTVGGLFGMSILWPIMLPLLIIMEAASYYTIHIVPRLYKWIATSINKIIGADGDER